LILSFGGILRLQRDFIAMAASLVQSPVKTMTLESFLALAPRVVVKNTFVELADGISPSNIRSKSEPRSIVKEARAEGRGRSFTLNSPTKDEALELCSNTSTQLPASSNGSSLGSLGDAPLERIVDLEVRESYVRRWSDMCDSETETESANEIEGGATTLMFRNLPEGFTRLHLERLLEAEGFGQAFDFLYLPADLRTGACFGYAFVNLVSTQSAASFLKHFQGFEQWAMPSGKRALVHVCEGIQGKEELSERYRNSPLMHNSVSEVLRPAVYCKGVRARFPSPTVAIKAPKVRAARPTRSS
jgi:hypothetical protein